MAILKEKLLGNQNVTTHSHMTRHSPGDAPTYINFHSKSTAVDLASTAVVVTAAGM